MNEKKYLNFWQKAGYGSGDWAANMVYGLITTFSMVYLTTTAGLNAGIIGTLIMLSKFADGITDILFGSFIDRTKSKMGKARPWMLFSYLGNAVCLIAVFSIPSSLGDTAKYVYFFITYTLLNAIFYTANNIAYSALTSLITKNNNERVQLGTFRFIFSTLANMFCNSFTMAIVYKVSGGEVATAAGWRAVAILYAIIGLIVNTISVFSVRELPEEENAPSPAIPDGADISMTDEKITLFTSLKLLMANRYFIMITALYILSYFSLSVSMGVAAYYFMYVVGDMNKFSSFMNAYSLTSIAALIVTPFVVRALQDMRKFNIISFAIQTVFRILMVFIAFQSRSFLLLTVVWAACAVFNCSFAGTINAFIAEASEYTFLKTGKRIEGSMYSCASLGIKVGSGIGSGISGWLLAAVAFDGSALVQTAACNQMITSLFTVVPAIVTFVCLLLFTRLKVEEANAGLRGAM